LQLPDRRGIQPGPHHHVLVGVRLADDLTLAVDGGENVAPVIRDVELDDSSQRPQAVA